MSTPIGTYAALPAWCHAYDPRAPLVARRVAQLITSHLPDVQVEHVGSTAVPGCAGKGVIDLMVLYPTGGLEAAKGVLAGLGFQPQTGRDPWPEDRPMRIGALQYDGDVFRLHAHVIAHDSPEVHELRRFRDRLRADPQLLAAYVARKRGILRSGIDDPVDYSIAKGGFCTAVLQARTARPPLDVADEAGQESGTPGLDRKDSTVGR